MADRQAAATERQIVVFELNEEACGVDIDAVQEIVRVQGITGVPGAPRFFEGVVTLHGKVIPVVDLRARFSMPAVERTDTHRIVVVDVEGQDAGMVVDSVTEVTRVPEASIEPPSAVATSIDSGYLTGTVRTGQRLVMLIDIAKAISSDEARRVADAARQASSEAAA